MGPKKGKQAAAAAADSEEEDPTPQDLNEKGASYGRYYDATLGPLVSELLNSLEEAVEY